jgi:nitrogen regulatory protein PII
MDFKLLLIVVDSERVEQVLEAVLTAGATGATILSNARGLGLSQKKTFLGLSLFERRDIVLVLVDAGRADKVLQVAEDSGRLDETLGTGIALQLPVDKAVGLTEHIRRLTELSDN